MVLAQPLRGADESFREPDDIEPEFAGGVVDVLFVAREQVDEDGAEAAALEYAGDALVARAESATPATMREQHDRARVKRNSQVRLEGDAGALDPDRSFGRSPSPLAHHGA